MKINPVRFHNLDLHFVEEQTSFNTKLPSCQCHRALCFSVICTHQIIVLLTMTLPINEPH